LLLDSSADLFDGELTKDENGNGLSDGLEIRLFMEGTYGQSKSQLPFLQGLTTHLPVGASGGGLLCFGHLVAPSAFF
jgi:hypothetical protein